MRREKDGIENPSRVGLSKRPTLDICPQEVTNWKLRGRAGTSEINRTGASLGVQSLRFHTSGDMGLISGRETRRSHMPRDVAPQKQKTLKLLHLLKNISSDWSRTDVLYTVNSLPWRTLSQDTETSGRVPGGRRAGERTQCGPIASWQIDRETVETVAGFTFLGSKITADGN